MSNHEEEEIERIIREFVLRHEQTEGLDPAAFADSYPESLRETIVSRCHAYIEGRELIIDAPSPVEEDREFGPFRLIRILRRGGSAIVHKAEDTRSGETVALKILHRHLLGSIGVRERFRREGEIACRFDHPHIVPHHEYGEVDGHPYIAMQLMPRSLADWIVQAREANAPAHERTTLAVRMGAQIARALHHIHEKGLIHRDVKPHNILLGEDGEAYLADFGLIRIEDEDLTLSLTREGQILGTAFYLSPEQGLARRVLVDHRTDIYSLGVVLYEMLTLHRPFSGSSIDEILYDIAFSIPSPPRRRTSEIPRPVEILCMKAMERSPAHRFSTAAAMADELERVQRLEAIVTVGPPLRRRVWSRIRLYRKTSAACALVLLALLVALVAGEVSERRAFDRRLAPVQAYLDGAPLPTTLEELEALAAMADQLDADHGAACAEETSALRELIAAVARPEVRTALAASQEAFAAPPGAPVPTEQRPDAYRLFSALTLAIRWARLLPESDPLRAEARPDRGLPRLLVTTADRDVEAEVWLYEMNLATLGFHRFGRRLGTTPLEVALPTGRYRIVVTTDDAYAEHTRDLRVWGRAHHIESRLLPTAEVVAGMVPVGGGAMIGGTEGDPGLPQGSYTVDPFYIDATEVTQGLYRRFLAEAGDTHRPLYWPEDWRPEYDDLPVVGVNLPNAMAFAEWSGKRLPTRLEWDRAARGPEGWRFPWGNADADRLGDVNIAKYDPSPWPEEIPARTALHLRHAQPVGTNPVDRRLEADRPIHDVLGNVAEWIDAAVIFRVGDLPMRSGTLGYVKGMCWRKEPMVHRELTKVYTAPSVAPITAPVQGFRCAKSRRTP